MTTAPFHVHNVHISNSSQGVSVSDKYETLFICVASLYIINKGYVCYCYGYKNWNT